ncbi:MAG: hypothetical protein IPM06_17400 [Rhizobiales bacterium]|nr:hypothetical protein [Hyphomicrobiales bacterium]
MTPPSREQIEATTTQPIYEIAYWLNGIWNSIDPDDVQDADPQHSTSADLHGVAFGASVGASCTIVLADTPALRALPWAQLPVRVSFGFATSNLVDAFRGIVMRYARDGDTITWSCAGLDVLLSTIPIYSPLLAQRLMATATSGSTQEDPAISTWRGGIINYIFWMCGGRPLEQQASFPAALFYYTCQAALIAPAWSWVAGENAWDELQRLCTGGGGQVVQRPDGVFAYSNPLSFGAGPSTMTITSAHIDTFQIAGDAHDMVASVRCRVTNRLLQLEQAVYEDATPRLIGPGAPITIVCDMAVPVYDYVFASSGAPTLPEDAVLVTTLGGIPATGITATLTQIGAARATLQISSSSGQTVVCRRIMLRGRPVAVVGDEQLVIGNGTPQLEISDDVAVLIQTADHAQMIGSLYTSFYGQTRPVVTLSLLYDPDRKLGERVTLNLPDDGFAMVPMRIVAVRVQETGARMELDVVSVAGLPTDDQFFLLDTVYADSDTRQLSY